MTMLALVVTSVIISQAVFSFLPLTSTPTSRQIHTLVAYLALLAVGAHLGLHGPMIMGVGSKLFMRMTFEFWDFETSPALLPASRGDRGTVRPAFALPRQVASQGIAEPRCGTGNVS